MAPSNLNPARWTPTRDRAFNLVKAGKVRVESQIRGGERIIVAGASGSDARVLAKAILWLEEIGAVRQRPGGSTMEVI